MVSWVLVIDMINDISPALDLIIASLLVVVTYLLARYTKLLYKSTSDQGRHIKSQAKNLEIQTGIMNKQVGFLDRQGQIMEEEAKAVEEDRRFRMRIEKYKRLRDEMDKLVAPLYVHAFGYTEENPGHFTVFYVGELEKLQSPYKQRSEFWNNILKNSHLSQSKDLSEYLGRHYESNINHAISKSALDRQKVIDNAPHLVKKIIERYSQLEGELKEVEMELGIRRRN